MATKNTQTGENYGIDFVVLYLVAANF